MKREAPFPTIRSVVERFGGAIPLGQLLGAAIGVPPERMTKRIRAWIALGRIPGWMFAPILEAAKQAGVDLDPVELAAAAAARKQHRLSPKRAA